jgi:hypothetical protein
MLRRRHVTDRIVASLFLLDVLPFRDQSVSATLPKRWLF